MKQQQLDGNQLALLWTALSRDLFPRPEKGEVLYKSADPEGCILYFDENYYEILTTSINQAYSEGKFSNSNAERDWIDLAQAIGRATVSLDLNRETLKIYELYKGSSY